MANRFTKRFLLHPDKIKNHRHLRWLGPAIHEQNLWQLNRRSVAGGVAVGFFFAFMLPLAQFIAAAIAAIFLRVNLPVALTSTLITNPFTFGPWYYLAYKIGALMTGAPDAVPPAEPQLATPVTGSIMDVFWQGLDGLLSMGQPLLIGLVILAVTSAIGGYLLVNALWRTAAWFRLRRQRQARAGSRY